MADIEKITSDVRRPLKSAFSSHSGTVGIEEKRSQDGSIRIWWIYASAPTEGNFTTTEEVDVMYLVDTTGAAAAKVSYDQGSNWAAMHA